MADLKVSYDYLDDLGGTLADVATLSRLDESIKVIDHAVSGSSTVEAAGNEAAGFQKSLATILGDNIDTIAASVDQAATTLAEADAKLSTGAAGGRPVNGGAF